MDLKIFFSWRMRNGTERNQFIYISINSVIFYFDFSVKLRFCNDCILLQASNEKNAIVLHNIHVILEASSLVHDYVLLK